MYKKMKPNRTLMFLVFWEF